MNNYVAVYDATGGSTGVAKKLPYDAYEYTPEPILGYLLKEDGFRLLQENGSKIIL